MVNHRRRNAKTGICHRFASIAATFITFTLLLALHSAPTALANDIRLSTPKRAIRGVANDYDRDSDSDSGSDGRNAGFTNFPEGIQQWNSNSNEHSHDAYHKYGNQPAHLEQLQNRQPQVPRNLEGGGLFPEEFFRKVHYLKKSKKDKSDRMFGKKHTKKKENYGKGSSGTSNNSNNNMNTNSGPTPSPISNGLIHNSLTVNNGIDGDSGSNGSVESKKDTAGDFFGSTGNSSPSDNSNANLNTDSAGATSPTPSPNDNGLTQAPFIAGVIDSSNNNDGSIDSMSEESSPISDADSTNAQNTNGADNDGESNGSSDSTDDNNDVICLAISSQEPPEAQSGSSTTEILVSVDVVYQTDVVSSTDIQSYLDDKNIAMALWIAGCEDEAISAKAMDAVTGTRRKLQAETASITSEITYSEVSSWTTTSLCEEADSRVSNNDEFINGLLVSSSPSCQQSFSTTIQIQATGDDSSVYLKDKITEAFYTAVKPSLDDQSGVIAVAIDNISEQIVEQDQKVDGIQSDTQQSIAESNNNRKTVIIAFSIVGACLLVCNLSLVLIYLYKKRLKYGPNRVNHVRFNDEVEINFDDDDKEQDNDLVLLSTNEIMEDDEGTSLRQRVVTFDDSITDEEYDDYSGGDDDLSDFDIPEPPVEYPYHNAANPDRHAPIDEYANNRTTRSSAAMGVQESRTHQILSIESTGPVNAPMNITPNTFTAPRIDRYRLIAPTIENSRRKYSLADDLVDL